MIAPETMSELSETYPLKVIEADPGDVLYFHTGLIHDHPTTFLRNRG